MEAAPNDMIAAEPAAAGETDRRQQQRAHIAAWLEKGGTLMSLCRDAFLERNLQYREAL